MSIDAGLSNDGLPSGSTGFHFMAAEETQLIDDVAGITAEGDSSSR